MEVNKMDVKKILEKIKDYEHFINDKLKNDLKEIETTLNHKITKHKDWEDVINVVNGCKEFKEKDRDMLVQFEMGCGVNAFAEITEYDTTYIDIGLGCLLEMDCEEATKYSNIRLRLLNKEIEHLRKLAVDVKVHIKMVLLAINELQSSLLPSQLSGMKSF